MKEHKNTFARYLVITAVGIAVILLAFQLVANSGANTTDSVASSNTSVATTNTSTRTQTATNSSDSSTAAESATETTSAGTVTGQEQTLTASESYAVPMDHGGGSGSETIDLTVTLDADNIITAVDTTHSGSDHHSAQYQSAFDQSYESYVVGESIDNVQLSRIAGASLTTDAFNLAIDDILAQL